MPVFGSAGSPTTIFAATAAARASASPSCSLGTSMRVGALQLWPVLFISTATPCATACSSGAPLRMMFGDLPPSSSDTFLTVSAAALSTSTPARVEPVNETMSTSGCDASAAPTVGPSPSTRLKTPAGTPAACRISAMTCAENGASSLGLSTIVQPVARAGATLQAIWFAGQFQGVISPHTPTGSRTMRSPPMSFSNSNSRSTFSATAKWLRPAGACMGLAIVASGAPISCEMASARSSIRSLYSSMTRSSSAIRSSRVECAKLSKARRAAATARSTSAALPREIWPATCSVAGFTTSKSRPSRGVTQCPSM